MVKFEVYAIVIGSPANAQNWIKEISRRSYGGLNNKTSSFNSGSFDSMIGWVKSHVISSHCIIVEASPQMACSVVISVAVNLPS